MIQLHHRKIFFLSIALVLIVIVTYLRHGLADVSKPITEDIKDKVTPPPEGSKTPKYKPTNPVLALPVIENFPLAAAAHSISELPPIPSWNLPPSPHVEEKTPLFIGFTRNWRVLQQVVVSYITAGWPPEDIYVVENTGVMDSNSLSLLSLQNPFFLNHTRLNLLGVNILTTPTLLTFAQLQNFYLYTSVEKKWDYYFWSHMDIIVTSFEERYDPVSSSSKENRDKEPLEQAEPHKFHSIYTNCLNSLRKTLALPKDAQKWAMRFFSYDRLALVNVQTFKDVGGWDTMIPFYTTDCDMHFRLSDSGYSIIEEPAGMVYDVASSLGDLIVLYRKKTGEGPDGFKVPEPGFQDPNIIEKQQEELAEVERLVAEAGLNKRKHSETEPEAKAKRSPVLLLHLRNETAASSSLDPKNAPPQWLEDNPFPSPSPLFLTLLHTFDAMSDSKHANTKGRNTWQARATGGEGDPFYRDSAGFQTGIDMWIEYGRNVFAEKWGHRDCDLGDQGLRSADAWRVLRDWDE